MPRKPDEKEEINITVKQEKPEVVSAPATIPIRCIWDSRLIIGSSTTISGQRYEFNPGEEKPVDATDYVQLLTMETRPLGCCGGSNQPQKYFEEV